MCLASIRLMPRPPWQAGHRPSASMLLRSITKPRSAAALSSAARTGAAGASATASQARQIRKAGAWASPGCMQAVKAFSRRMRCASPLFHQEIQRPIGHGRLVAEPFRRQPLQHVIGPQRAMRLEQDLQHPAAHRGQPHAPVCGQSLGPRHHVARAMGMVVMGKGASIGRSGPSGGLLTCYDITYDNRSDPDRKGSIRCVIPYRFSLASLPCHRRPGRGAAGGHRHSARSSRWWRR